MTAFLSLVLVLLVAFPATAIGDDRTQRIQRNIQIHREHRGQVQEQLDDGRSQLETVRRQERQIIDQLDQMELQLQEIRDSTRRLRGERDSVRREVAEKRARLKELNRELEGLQTLLSRPLGALYKFGRQAYLEFVLSARSLSIAWDSSAPMRVSIIRMWLVKATRWMNGFYCSLKTRTHQRKR